MKTCDICGRNESEGGPLDTVPVARSEDGETVMACAICRQGGITTAEAAILTGVMSVTVRAAVAAGKLPARKAGRDWLIAPSDLEAWRSAAKVGKPAATDWEPCGTVVGNCPTCAERRQAHHIEASFHVERRGANRRYACEVCGTVTRRKPRGA